MAMPKNYLQRSDSVKKTALTMRRSGNTPKEIREKLDVPESTLRKWVAAAKVAGTFETGQGDVARPPRANLALVFIDVKFLMPTF